MKADFFKLLNDEMPESDFDDLAAENVFEEMTRKLSNTRIQEFLTSQKQKMASRKGYASTKGQNLRDTLLAQHSNIHTRTKI